jgi:MFS family permease
LSAPAAEAAPAAVLRRSTLSILVLAVTFAVFTNLAMFQALLPAEITRSGGSRLEVGEATSLFSAGTVACELLTVFLATRFPMAHLLAAGTLVIGVATLGYMVAGHTIPALLALTAARGGAFGVDVVTTSYLVAAYAAPAQRGRALGIYGLAVSLPATFGISLGLIIQSTAGPRLAYALGAAPAVAAGLVFAAVLARTSLPAVAPPCMRLNALPPLLTLASALALVTMTYGGLLSFGPALVGGAGALLFLAFGIARAAARPVAGLLCDRLGARPVLLASLAVLAAGCAALPLLVGVPAAIVSGTLYGAGLGGISNAAYVALLERSEESGQAVVSATWSTAFDGGVAIGGAAFAAVAQGFGMRGVALVLPAVALLPILLTLGDGAVRRRSARAG